MYSKIDATDPKNGSAPGGGTEEKNESSSLFCAHLGENTDNTSLSVLIGLLVKIVDKIGRGSALMRFLY